MALANLPDPLPFFLGHVALVQALGDCGLGARVSLVSLGFPGGHRNRMDRFAYGSSMVRSALRSRPYRTSGRRFVS